MSKTLINSAEEFGKSLKEKPLIRAVNFHSTPRARLHQYREQLAFLGKNFSSVSEEDLDRYLITGLWHKSKPGVIVALYDGSRNGFDVMAPLLDEFGLIGWFFVVTEFVKAPGESQIVYGAEHDIGFDKDEYTDGRFALSWEEIRSLDRRHVIASHARSHILLASLDASNQESEILGSQEDFREHLGHSVRTFVSFGGPAFGAHLATDALIKKGGYNFVFSNLRIQRLESVKKAS